MPRPDELRYKGQADGPLEGGLPKGGVAEAEGQMDVVEGAPAEETEEGGAVAAFVEEDIPGVSEEDFEEDSQDPDDKLLFQPTLDPSVPITAGLGGREALLPPPANVVEWLPVLAQAASAPDAPEQVKALLRLVTHHLRG